MERDQDTETPSLTGETLVVDFPADRDPEEQSIVHRPERPASTVPGDSVLRPEIASQLSHDLYSHQATALDALTDGQNVCVATSTASGKTLVFALQIARNYLDARRTGSVSPDDGPLGNTAESTAYVIYPTKALSRDQERELNDCFDELGLDITVSVYDGDTETGETRKRIRAEADVIITNFAGVNTYLHDHDRWARFFGACDLLVVDESHTYTGVHGMHVAWIIRRLKRVLSYYGSDPQFVLTSATIGNPGAHSAALIDESVTVVDEDGSPRGKRELVLWNPPLRFEESSEPNADAPERLPATIEAPQVFSHLTYHDVQTLLFAPSRKLAELSIERSREFRRQRGRYYTDPDRGRALEPYHAGHSREKRHSTEHQLKNGLLDGVASTNALELGVNIGTMDATVQMGYPGQRQSFWQQIGRAGRGTDRALSVLVAEHRTLDQYVIDNPDYLLETDVEDAVVDTENDAVFAQHVRCAASELALEESDGGTFADSDRLAEAVEMWRRAGQFVGHLETGVSYVGPPRPQSRISLYATAGDEYEVRLAEGVDDRYDPEMEPLARERVVRDFHEGAVRLHDGQQYEVIEVVHDTPQPFLRIRPTDVDYYTQTRTEVTVLDAVSKHSREIRDFEVHYGTGTVLVYHGTYDRTAIHGGKRLAQSIPTNNPPIRMETQLCWVEVPRSVERRLIDRYSEFSVPEIEDERGPMAHLGYVGGLHAAEHAMIGVAPLELLVDKRDLGGLSTLTIDSHLAVDSSDGDAKNDRHDGVENAPGSIDAARATIRQHANDLDGQPASGWFVYDGIEGGLGFSKAIYDNFEALAKRARNHIFDCACDRVEGCPACVMDEQCGNDNVPLHRDSAVDLFDRLLGYETDGTDSLSEDSTDSRRRPTLFYS